MLKSKSLVKIAFLDRDGVINSSKINGGYVGKIKDFKWIRGAKKALKYLKQKKFKIVIVSNQSGIARGFFLVKDVELLHRYLKKELQKIKVKIDGIYYCPYHKDGIIKKFTRKSSLRKPDIGMFKLALKRWNIDRSKSFMIGDQKTDMEFAKKSKIKGFLFKSNNLYYFVKRKINIS